MLVTSLIKLNSTLKVYNLCYHSRILEFTTTIARLEVEENGFGGNENRSFLNFGGNDS